MATTPIVKGRTTEFLFADEANFGVAPASGYKPTVYYTHNLRQARPLEDDPLIGGNLHNSNDSTEPHQGLPDVAGDIVVPADLAHIGYWLKLLLGAPTTTGTTNYTHAFSSGAAQLPTRTIEMKNAASDFHQFVGVGALRMSMDISDQPGQQRATVSLIGKKRTLLSSTGAGTPASIAALDALAATLGSLLIDDVAAGSIMSMRLNFESGIAVDRYCDGDEFASAVVIANDAKLTGEFRARYPSTGGQTLEAVADAKTAKKLEFLWSKGANNSLSFIAGNAYLEPAGAPVDGPGGIQRTFSFQASQTAAAAMLAVTLKNQIASY
jgi:hypothetical protein